MSDKHERDSWDEAGAVPVTGEDLEQGRPPSAPASDVSSLDADAAEPQASVHDKPEALAKLATDTDLASDVTATDAEAGWNEAAEKKRKASPKAVAVWSGRSLFGLVAIGAAAAVGFAAVWAFGSGALAVNEPSLGDSITPSAGAQRIVCAPGQLQVASGDSGSSIEQVSEATTSIPEVDGATTTELTIDNVAGASLTSVSAPADGQVLSGMSWTQVDEQDIAGFADAACIAPAASQWLVGGSTTTGRSSIIVLANPSEQVTTVRLEVFSAEGVVDAAATSAITIEPGSATAIDLASLSVDNESPAVFVRSEGSAVAAFMQHSIIRGLEPGGIDTVTGQPAASTDQTFVGVPLSGRTSANVEDAGDVQSTLRLVADSDTVARIEFRTPGQQPAQTEVPLTAGTTVDMNLADLPAGQYTIDIQSDVPVAAGLRTLPAEGDVGADLAWLTPSRTIDGTFTIDARPRGHDRELVILNATDEEQVIIVDGDEQTLAAGALFSTELGEDPVVVEGEGMRASVAVEYVDIAGGFALQPAPAASTTVTVEY